MRQAESRGVLLEESLTLVDVGFWLEMIDWQSKFLTLVLNFTKDPNRKSLRPLIELFGRDPDRMRAEVEILERQLKHRLAPAANASRRMPMTKPHSFDDPSGRKKKEHASPYLEFLAKVTTNARRISQISEFAPGRAAGIRHADLMAGERVLNELIYERQRSLEAIEHARLELEARGWARANGLRR